MGAGIMFLYVAIGVVVSAIYCLLAGWSVDAFITGIVMSPFLLYFWAIAANWVDFIVPKRNRLEVHLSALIGKRSDQIVGSIAIFWCVTLFCLLPILVRVISIFVGVLGNEQLATVLYERRYLSMAYALTAFGALIVLDVCYEFLADSIRSFRQPTPVAK